MFYKELILHLIVEFFISIPKDPNYIAQRKKSSFKRKKDITKNLWIASGMAMIMTANPYAMFVISLLTTLVSFAILYETP